MSVRQMLVGAVFVIGLGGEGALAQLRETKIWDVALGTHVSELPQDEFVRQACGTNGGPPSLALEGFADFGRCPADVATGLHEVWFSYDNEAEYIARAYRAPEEQLGQFRANTVFDHPVNFSFLIDDDGRVRGYRVVSDTREDYLTRFDADVVARGLKLTVYDFEGWTCTDLPPVEGEEPIEDRFVKELCQKITDDGRHVSIENHAYLKPGQARRQDDARVIYRENEFEVSVRLEVIDADLVPGRPGGN